MPVDSIQPMYQANRISRKSAMDKPMRMVNAFTVRLDLLLSFMRKKKAEPRLARMPRNARPMINFMVNTFQKLTVYSTQMEVCHG